MTRPWIIRNTGTGKTGILESARPDRLWSGHEPGYTLIELMIVITIVGILATLAEPSFRGAVLRAKEVVLKQDLFTLRDAIDQYRADRGSYPLALGDLKTAGYLKRLPIDPFTKSEGTWQELMAQEGGVFDVHSGSDLAGQDGTPYNQW